MAMRHIVLPRLVKTEETHRATAFEIFFDLVFVFALTRTISFMAQPPTPLILAQGLVILLLLWWSFTAFAWLGNQVRADVGVIRAGMLVAMAAIFVAALVIPYAWRHGDRAADAPLTLAVAYIVVRVVHLCLFLLVAADNRRLRVQVLLYGIPTALGWTPLIVGALLGGTAQTLLWLAALIAESVGNRLVSTFRGWRVHSPGHFVERHALVLIIALGESLTSVGAGAGSAVTQWPVMVAALLGFTITVCLWWLYFENASGPAGRALGRMPEERRADAAGNAYSLSHILLIAGIIYLALGIEQVLTHVAHNQLRDTAGAPLDWAATTALYGGVVVYLVGRILFLRFTVGHVPPAQVAATGLALVLLPAARILPALASLGLLTAFLIALACYERFAGDKWSSPTPSPAR